MLYGVKTWGWVNREHIERLHARYVKMAMGVNRNTLSYIWRMEAGVRRVGTELWKRAANYLVEVVEMNNDRWPKKCLREEIRGILNRNPSKWGKQLMNAMDEVGEGGIWNCISKGNFDELANRMKIGMNTKIDQEIQLDWSKIGRSKFCAGYIRIEKRILKWKHNISKKKNWKGQLKRRERD